MACAGKLGDDANKGKAQVAPLLCCILHLQKPSRKCPSIGACSCAAETLFLLSFSGVMRLRSCL